MNGDIAASRCLSNTAVLIFFLLKLLAKFYGNLCAGNLLLASPSCTPAVLLGLGMYHPSQKGNYTFYRPNADLPR